MKTTEIDTSSKIITISLNGTVPITNKTVRTEITCSAVKAPNTATSQVDAKIKTKSGSTIIDGPEDVPCVDILPNVLGELKKTIVPGDNRTAMVTTLTVTINKLSNTLQTNDKIILGPFPKEYKLNAIGSTDCTVKYNQNTKSSSTSVLDGHTVQIQVQSTVGAEDEVEIICSNIRSPRKPTNPANVVIETTDANGNKRDRTDGAVLGQVVACAPTSMCLHGEYVSGEKSCGDNRNCSPCPLGHYCSGGVVDKQECPAGTYGNETNLTQSNQCRTCPNSKYYSPPGRTAMSDCLACPNVTVADDGAKKCKCVANYVPSGNNA